MPKLSTNPIIIDNLLNISIKDLRLLGFFNSPGYKNESILWIHLNPVTGKREEMASIQVYVSIQQGNGYVNLDYYFNDIPTTRKIELIRIQSNLGNEKMWSFLCPDTGTRCMKLYLLNGELVSRKSIPRGYYSYEIESKRIRLSAGEKLLFSNSNNEVPVRYFKPTYCGKATKRFLKLMKLRAAISNKPTVRFYLTSPSLDHCMDAE